LLAPSQRPLRICFISPYPPEKEGVADYLALLVKTLITTDPRIEITVISQVDNSVSYNSEYIGQHLRIIRNWKPNSLASLLRIRSFLVRQKFDWVHLQYGPYGKYGGVLGEPLLLLFAGLRRHAKTAITLHTIWFPGGLGIRLRQKYRLNAPSAKIIFLCFQVFLRVFCHLFDRIILLTHTTDRRIANIVSSVFRVENQRLEEWILPFKEPTFETSRRSEQNRSKVNRSIVILCPGFISPRKGIDTLLNAFQLLPSHESIRLRFVGQTLTKEDKNLLRRLTGLVTQSTLDGLVEFVTNGVDGNVIEQEARDSDVIVLPSAYRVGPSSLICRLAGYGVPIVTTYDPVFLPPGTTVPLRLVPPNDPPALAEAIWAVASNVTIHKSISEQLQRWAMENQYTRHARLHLDEYRGND